MLACNYRCQLVRPFGFSGAYSITGPGRSAPCQASPSGPQPHPSFIDFSCAAPLGDGYRAVEGAGEAAEAVKGNRLTASPGSSHFRPSVLRREATTAGILNRAAFVAG